MDNDLPEFEQRTKRDVQPFVQSIFGNNLVKLTAHDDGHFRVVFAETQFTLTAEKSVPSKSQWSTLKKKFKRRDSNVFVFKETGHAECAEELNAQCYYVDFGFFAY